MAIELNENVDAKLLEWNGRNQRGLKLATQSSTASIISNNEEHEMKERQYIAQYVLMALAACLAVVAHG